MAMHATVRHETGNAGKRKKRYAITEPVQL